MKQIELELKKKLFIAEDYTTGNLDSYCKAYRKNNPDKYLKFICKGSKLTEEILKDLVRSAYGEYKDYNNAFTWIPNPKKSFISAIEAQGYYWGENPIGKYEIIDFFKASENTPTLTEWRKYESKTFNPGKTLIFEIL